MSNTRNIKAAPFCWQSKLALRKIQDACASTGDGASVRSVYVALTQIASDEQSDTFKTTQDWIALKSSVSVPTVKRSLHVLEELKLVKVITPQLRAPSTFTLLAHGELTLDHGELALAHSAKRAQRATLEESEEESTKNDTEQLAAKTPRKSDLILDCLVALDGSNPAFGAAAKARKLILEVCPNLTVEEITRRATNYKSHFPTCTCSAPALAKWWSKCDTAPKASPTTTPAKLTQHTQTGSIKPT